MKTETLYGDQSFNALLDAGCIRVYELHIELLENQLVKVTDEGDYHRGFTIQKAQNHFRKLIKQAMEHSNVRK